jgi:hypothetical protein
VPAFHLGGRAAADADLDSDPPYAPRTAIRRTAAGYDYSALRDPIDGTICYIYLPITAQHSPPAQSGYVQYGANTIGSISCVAPPPAPTAATQRKGASGQRTPASNPPEPLPNKPLEAPNTQPPAPQR